MRSAVTFILLLLVAGSGWAKEGLDLVVLVDRSTSMAGKGRMVSPLLRMAVDLVARGAAIDRVDHRLAIVTFGDSPRVDVPLTSVARDALPRFTRAIDALPDEDRGDTNFAAALLAAEGIVGVLPVDPSRRRAIVLVTDGVPWVRGAEMAAYRDRMRRIAATLAGEGVTLDVLLVAPCAPPYPAFWCELARGVDVVRLAPVEFLPRGQAAVARLVGTRTVESAPVKGEDEVETVVVAPYLEVVVFDVFRGSRDAEVNVFPPGSTRPIRGGIDGVEAVDVGEVLSTLVVPHPAPGQWLIRKSRGDAHVRIVSEQFFPRGELVRPAAAEPPRQYDRVPIAYSILDANRRAITELRDYPLAVKVMLTKPDGTSAVVAMDRDHAPGLFRSTGEADCDLAGRYWTDVRITTADDDGNRIDVFRDRWSGFSVQVASRIDCRITMSEPMWFAPSARLDCVDERRRRIQPGAIATSEAGLFRATLTREGRPGDTSLLLRPEADGSFQGRLWGVLRGGAFQLRPRVDRVRLRPAYNVRFVPRQLAFARRLPLEWLGVPLTIAAVVLLARRRATNS